MNTQMTKPKPSTKKDHAQTTTMLHRPSLAVTCPHCWTEQRSERNTCFRCGARFVYLDEHAKAQ